jgi:phosphonopyruvate decarboxylase
MSDDRVSPRAFHLALQEHGVDLFAGVPDSLLKELCAYLHAEAEPGRYIISANEGNAVATAAGYHIATGRFGAVFMQNSGLGNAVNPLLSLTDADVYRLPVLLVVGWRGEPDVPDEPQHAAQGRLTLPLLEALGIPFAVVDASNWTVAVAKAVVHLREAGTPYALVVRKNTFSEWQSGEPRPRRYPLKREAALEAILDAVGQDAVIVCSTGKASREVFEIRQRRGEGHANDFLTVGSMGHTSSIALGMALGTPRTVVCIDGDGALLMHLGATAVTAQHAPDNLRYIVINNGAHESVGGQPTVALDIDVPAILRASGFSVIDTVEDAQRVASAVKEVLRTPRGAIMVLTDQGSRPDLGRPTVSPQQNKDDLMQLLSATRD